MISLALFLLVFFSWIILLMLYSYNRWYKGQEMKMLRTKYILPTFRSMRYNVWMINDAIEKGGELIWGDEKFSPFFPIDLGISPYTSNPISIGVSISNCNGIKLKLNDTSNPDIVLYEPGDTQGKLLSNETSTPDRFEEFEQRVRALFASPNKEYLMSQVASKFPSVNGEIYDEGIREKIRGVTYPLVKRLIGYGVIEEVYEVRIRDRELMIENRKYIYHRVKMTPVFKVPREINNKAYKIIDDTDVSLTIVYKVNYVVNIDAQYDSDLNGVLVKVVGNPALELKRIGYGE
jgi:hypothetical protein